MKHDPINTAAAMAADITRRTLAGEFISIWDAPAVKADEYQSAYQAAQDEIEKAKPAMVWSEWITRAGYALDIVQRMRPNHWSRA